MTGQIPEVVRWSPKRRLPKRWPPERAFLSTWKAAQCSQRLRGILDAIDILECRY